MSVRLPPARVATVLVALLLVGGCVAPDGRDEGESEERRADGPWDREGRVYHLTGAGGLSPDAPSGDASERVPVASFPRTWGKDDGLPTFLTPPLDTDLLVYGANVTLYAEPRALAASTLRFVEWIAYLGPPGHANAAGVIGAEDVHRAGEVREILIRVEAPAGGLALRAGDQLSLIVFPVQSQDDAADATTLDLLMNASSTDARVVLETGSWASTPVTRAESGWWTGRLVGSAYAGEGLARGTHPFTIPPGTAELSVGLTVEDGAPFADLDLAVIAPDGTVFSSGTPYRVEGVRLLAPNLAGVGIGEWQVRVAAYGAVVSTYHVAYSASVASVPFEAALTS